jgi:SAM-dependent methyltransferase
MTSTETFMCRVCGSATTLKPLWQVRGFQWATCETCGSLLVPEVPTAEFWQTFYADDYYAGGEADELRVGAYVDYVGHRAFIQANLRRRVAWAVQQMQRSSGCWLDIGCAAGFLLDEVRRTGFAPYGLDYAAFGPAYAREHLQLPNARQGTLDDFPADFPRQFDVISFMDVLEHLPNQHDALQRAVDLLAPGGFVMGETFVPESAIARFTGRWWHAIDPPNHLAILSPKGIETLMSANKMRLVGAVFMPRRLALSSVISKFGGLGKKLATQVEARPALSGLGIPIQLFDARLWLYQKPHGSQSA